jgi:poly(3-hydroxybutyrate) depolymerase
MKNLRLTLVAACLALAGLSLIPGCNGARDTALELGDKNGKGFIHKTLVRNGHKRVYAVFVPLNYDPNQKYPMIVFLHGVGEGGSDAKANLRVGLAPFVADRANSFPFICLFPQSTGDWNENSSNAEDAIAAIDEVSKAYSVDTDRISLTGLSTGGYGTWAIGAKYKSKFAALVPMGSSAADGKDAKNLTDMPIWSFHNSGDPFAGCWNDESLCNEINALGGHAKWTKYEAGGHNCWETAYGDGALFAWLQNQRRKGTTAAPNVTPTTPKKTSSVNTNIAEPAAAVVTPIHRPATPTSNNYNHSEALVPAPL